MFRAFSLKTAFWCSCIQGWWDLDHNNDLKDAKQSIELNCRVRWPFSGWFVTKSDTFYIVIIPSIVHIQHWLVQLWSCVQNHCCLSTIFIYVSKLSELSVNFMPSELISFARCENLQFTGCPIECLQSRKHEWVNKGVTDKQPLIKNIMYIRGTYCNRKQGRICNI